MFCASLADAFDNHVPLAWRDDLWALIRSTPHLDWILLTKRIGNVAKMLPDDWGDGYPNVWLLITVVNQEEADRDVPKLLNTPAVVRGVSIEPMLGPVNLIGKDSGIDWVICGAESGPRRRPFDEDWARYLRRQCEATNTPFFYKQVYRDGRKVDTPELDRRQWVEFPGTQRKENCDD